jgi:hypothetical protein
VLSILQERRERKGREERIWESSRHAEMINDEIKLLTNYIYTLIVITIIVTNHYAI